MNRKKCFTQKCHKTSLGLRVYRVVELNQEVWLKTYIDINTKPRAKAKTCFEKDLLKLMKNYVFKKTMENVRNHRNIKLVTYNKRRIKLPSECSYHATKRLLEKLLATEMNQASVRNSKPVYMHLSVLDGYMSVLDKQDGYVRALV